MTIEEMIAVLQAAKAGKKLQCTSKNYKNDVWTDVSANPNFDFYRLNYRVKPEPREWWINVSSQGHPHYGYDDEATARHGLEMTCKTVRVREVLP